MASARAQDPVGKVMVIGAGIAGANIGWGLTLAALLDGAHVFRVRAVDPDGNADLSPAIAAWVLFRRPGARARGPRVALAPAGP